MLKMLCSMATDHGQQGGGVYLASFLKYQFQEFQECGKHYKSYSWKVRHISGF